MIDRIASGEAMIESGGGSFGSPPGAFHRPPGRQRRRPCRTPAGSIRAVGLALALVLAGCASSAAGPSAQPGETTEPSVTDLADAGRRAVGLEVGGCGAADPSRGSGLALADDLVLTAAHVVSSGGAVEVVSTDGPIPAVVVAYDPRRDLALVQPTPPLSGMPLAPSSGTLAAGQTGQIVGAATSGQVDATVVEVLIVEMDDVRSTTRSTRRAYLTEAATAAGDSGAGFYDPDGRLLGLLFAVSTTDDQRSWVTAVSEIDAFLVDDEVEGRFGCDADRSRITQQR